MAGAKTHCAGGRGAQALHDGRTMTPAPSRLSRCSRLVRPDQMAGFELLIPEEQTQAVHPTQPG